jgi:hypothetical protein
MNINHFPTLNEELNMGDKGKKDKARREGQKKPKLTIKEKRRKKKEKAKEFLDKT